MMLGQVLDKEPTVRLGVEIPISNYIQANVGQISNQYLISMVARSGSGKTATVFALAKKHFVIYALCSFRGSNSPDFRDRNFENLSEEVEEMCDELREDCEYDCKSMESILQCDKALKRSAMDRVRLDFLARMLLLLLLFEKNSQLQPYDFFLNQMNGGSRTIEQFVEDLKDYDPETITTMHKSVSTSLDNYLGDRALVIAVDEAHIAENILRGQLISINAIKDLASGKKTHSDIFDKDTNIRSIYRRGFLTPLCAALDGMNATIIMLGTEFKLLNAEYVYSASSKPNERHIRITNFPSANADDVGKILDLLLDMSGCTIPPEKKQRLSGRFRFTTYIIYAITRVTYCETKTKQQILNEAISMAEEKAISDARYDVKSLLQGNNRDENMYMLCRILIAFKLKGGQITFPKEENADFVNEKYSFNLEEPLIAKAIEEELKASNIDAEFSEYISQLNSVNTTFGITSSAKGEIFERLVGESLKRFNGMLIKDLPFVKGIKKLPIWCKTTRFRIDKIIHTNSTKEDIAYLKNPPKNEGLFPQHNMGPDIIFPLIEEDKHGKPLDDINYLLIIASKLHLNPIKPEVDASNTKSSNIRLAYSKSDGTPNPQLEKPQSILDGYNYSTNIKGTLRIHFVFPSVEGGTPKSRVVGDDVLIYIDFHNTSIFFDERIPEGAKEVRNIKKIIRYMMASKAALDELKNQKCGCTGDCSTGHCSCYKNLRNCTEWCDCGESCENLGVDE